MIASIKRTIPTNITMIIITKKITKKTPRKNSGGFSPKMACRPLPVVGLEPAYDQEADDPHGYLRVLACSCRPMWFSSMNSNQPIEDSKEIHGGETPNQEDLEEKFPSHWFFASKTRMFLGATVWKPWDIVPHRLFTIL